MMEQTVDEFSRSKSEVAGDIKTVITDRASYLPLLITSIAVMLFSTAGLARMMGWGPNSTDDSGGIPALDPAALVSTPSEARARPRCPECGVIVSIREIEKRDEDSGAGAAGGVTAGNRNEAQVKSTKRYEIVVRMADGSSRVIPEANPARWRRGERLIVIDGARPSNR
jgi:outer membrane lipoprotein SlyB